MPIQIDRKPGRKPLRKNGEVAPPLPPAPEPAPVTLIRVRATRDIVNSKRFGSLYAGRVKELPAADARDLIRMGFAEEDKSFDGAQETKSAPFDTVLSVKSPTVNVKTPKLGE